MTSRTFRSAHKTPQVSGTSQVSSYQADKTSQKTSRITILKYDRSTSTNFASYQKELEREAGLQYGALMSFTKTDKYATLRRPALKTVASSRAEELRLAALIEDDALCAEAIATINADYDATTVEEIALRINCLKRNGRSRQQRLQKKMPRRKPIVTNYDG